MHAGEEDHTRPGWTTSIRGQDSPWKSQSRLDGTAGCSVSGDILQYRLQESVSLRKCEKYVFCTLRTVQGNDFESILTITRNYQEMR